MRGPESRAIIRQLVCGRYCYLMLMPLDPIDTRARDGTKNRFHAAATKRRRRPPPAGDARAPSPLPPRPRPANAGMVVHEEADSGMLRSGVQARACSNLSAVYHRGVEGGGKPREGERSVGATRGKKSLYRATVSCYETLSRNSVVLRFFRSLEKL